MHLCIFISVINQLDAQNFCRLVHRLRKLSQPVHETATYRFDDIGGCIMQFWPPDDEHMCSKHLEAWNKLIVKQKFCASSWLITEINVKECQYKTFPLRPNIFMKTYTHIPMYYYAI